MISLYEILSTNKWMINPEAIPAFRSMLEMNISERMAIEPQQRVYAQSLAMDGSRMSYLVNGDDDNDRDDDDCVDEDAPFIDILYVTGPVMRHDGPCGAPGSMTIRDHMIDKCRRPKCLGHIFYIDTPGGSAAAKADFESAIQTARSLGQPVIAFVDGLCASAGMYLAAMCDERYYMHPDNLVGCIGVMAAFYTEKNGSYNQYTNETYREVYDPESFDKNGEIRALSNDDDEAPMQNELAALGRQFRADVLKACPNATDEHLHGRLFPASEVTGILMDGQSTLDDVVKRIISLSSSISIDGDSSLSSSATSGESSPSKTINSMQYPNINQALGMTEGLELQVTEEGATLHTDLLDAIEQRLTEQQESLDAANLQVATLGQQHDADAEVINQLREQIANEQSSSIDHEAQFTALREQLSAATQQLSDATQSYDAQIQQLRDELAASQQQLADSQQQVASLTANPQPEQQPSPSNNGQGASTPRLQCSVPQYDPSKSVSENRRILDEYMAQRQRQAFAK